MGLFEVAVLVALAVVAVLQLVLLLRKTAFETPVDLHVRLAALEQQSSALTQANTRGEAAYGRIEQNLGGFIDKTAFQLDQSRQALDDKLEKTVAESRSGRQELLTAFAEFETKLLQRVGSLDSSLSARMGSFQVATQDSLESSRQTLELKMAQALSDAREGRVELTTAFQAFEAKLGDRLSGFESAMGGRFVDLQQVLLGRLDEASKNQMAQHQQAQQDAQNNRKELVGTLAVFRAELTSTVDTKMAQSLTDAREGRAELTAAFRAFEGQLTERLSGFEGSMGSRFVSLQAGIQERLDESSKNQKAQYQQAQQDAQNSRKELTDALSVSVPKSLPRWTPNWDSLWPTPETGVPS